MGGLTSAPPKARGWSARRGLLRRPLLLFGLLLLGPAAGFCALGWRSVEREGEARRHDAVREAGEILTRRVEAVVADLEALRRTEEARPYYEYQADFVPDVLAGANVAVQENTLGARPSDPRVVGWFQWEAAGKGVPEVPEAFGEDVATWQRPLVEAYGAVLRAPLVATGSVGGLAASREVPVPLRVVIGNDQRGQLFEELQIIQNRYKDANAQRPRQQAEAPNAPAPLPQEGAPDGDVPNAAAQSPAQTLDPQAQSASPFLESYLNLPLDRDVPVRYSAFRYLARGADLPGPPLVAWRTVEIPAVPGATRARRLVQGYALDPGRALTAGPENVGPALLGRADALPGVAARASLTVALGADVLAGGDVPAGAAPDASLLWGAAADLAGAEEAAADARRRFLLLVAGLVTVVGLGFVVLLRGVRKEVGLARRKEDFLAAVTHELKTPLTGIRMYAEMLREGWSADEDAARAQAQRILDETTRLGTLVDQVLDLAAIDRGVARPDLVPGDLGAAVRSAVEAMQARATDAGAELALDVAGGLPPVPFDGRLVRPLVLNLVDNAIKYSDRAATKRVEVSLRRDGDRVALAVADRGAGIPPEVRARLFEPFQRAEGELTRASRGIGIGLALVKRYADAHRAAVAVDSTVGQGTTVTVRFPL